MMLNRIISTLIFLLTHSAFFAQEIDVNSYYQLYNLHQGAGMVLAQANENEEAIMTQNIIYEGKLWQFEHADSGYYYLKNVALGSSGYLHSSIKGNKQLFFSKKEEDPKFMWKFVATPDGSNFINKYYGDGYVLDCDSNPTGSIIYITRISGTSGQFWFLTKTLKLPFSITSLRVYDDHNTLVIDNYPLSIVTAILHRLETQGTWKLDEDISPELRIETPYSVRVEYVKEEKIYHKEFKFGDTIHIANF